MNIIIDEDGPNGKLCYTYDDRGNLIKITHKNGTITTDYYVVCNSRGDSEAIYNSSGTLLARYTYDSWGKVISIKDASNNEITSSSHIANLNPIRYRGYYLDKETNLYYLGSRYYDPEVKRFISSDNISVVSLDTSSFYDKNLYAYCDNNPVSREDTSGYVWDTALDIISLCASVADVLANPYDPWAWAGLAGDTIDLIPFVTGVGEITKVAKITISTTDNTTDVINVTRKLYNSTAKNSGFRTFTGYYEILYESGMSYVGKGGLYRSTVSALNHAATNNDIVKSITRTPAHNKIEAFFYEYILMDKYGGPKNEKLYNSIWSPGKKYFDLLFGGK